MKISIVTVVYNGESTIGQAAQSVISQDYPNLEYIVIDGGSKDKTVDILKAFGDQISVLISEPDKGIYDAMNKGLAQATGDVIGILNADDFYTDHTVLTSVAKALETSGADCLIGDLIFVAPDDLDKVKRFYSSANFELKRFEKGDMPPHPTFFARKELYAECGNFDTSYRITADYDLMLRMMYKKKASFTYLPKVMVTMRMGGVSNQGLKSKIKLNKEIMRSMRTNGLPSGTWRVYSKYITKVFQLFKRPSNLVENQQN